MAMRKLQPEIKRIKKEAKGDRQKEYALMTELYKEREVRPFASIGILLAQLPILLALFYAINKIVQDSTTVVSNAYGWVQNLPFIEDLASGAAQLDTVFLGFVDLTQTAAGDGSLGALVLVIGSVIVQYYQSKQLMMTDKDARGLRQILKDSSQGKEVDQTEIQAATSKFTLYIIPLFLFFVAINLAAALSLYWLVGGIIALIQQTRILKRDFAEMEAIAAAPSVKTKAKKAKKAEIVKEPVPAVVAKEPKVHKKTGVKTYVKTADTPTPKPTKPKQKKSSKKKSKKKRR
jgi:YidC/Oxa1 family membrane protein insertase